MNSKKKKLKVVMLLLAMAGGLLLASPMVAQNYGSQGLFGKGNYNDDPNRSEVGASGLLNQGFGATSGALTNQGFGSTQGGVDNQGFGGTQGGITNQTFSAPLGCGLLIMLAAGAGYATLKKRKSNR